MSQRLVKGSPVDKLQVDSRGAAIGAARMNPELAYSAVPLLLKEVIDSENIEAWDKIRTRIDAIYECMTSALDALDAEVSFSHNITYRVGQGQKLVFKPNLVNPACIDRSTHGPGTVALCTPWPFIAALMRWFHDRLGITYHQMSLGEGGTSMSATAAAYNLAHAGKQHITTEAVLEGKWGTGYGGWGFYFVRKYLAETHPPVHTDNPMNGYEESLAGLCLPPGKARDKLMIYDINKIADDGSNGRDVPVARGINYKSITLHKAIVGGNPEDPVDVNAWPKCILVNVPKLKIHNLELLTNAIKNLGVGLYPMEANASRTPGETRWKYAVPHKPVPGYKSSIPHSVWIAELDADSGMPRRDKEGQLILKKTGGLSATMADVIEAVEEQGIMMLHVTDAIEPTNRFHGGAGGVAVPEGYVFASTDPVALDLFCARYMFTSVPSIEAKALQKQNNLPTHFLQKVPIPTAEGQSITTHEGFDSPVSRYGAFNHCQERGLGQQEYYIVGRDLWEGGSLASFEGHLGRVKSGKFVELVTKEMYFAAPKPVLDLQATTLAYARANDTLTGSAYQAMLQSLDENGDGIIEYDDKEKVRSTIFGAYNVRIPAVNIETMERLRIRFLLATIPLRCTKTEWNASGFSFNDLTQFNSTITAALDMAQKQVELPDSFVSGMVCGKGKWPTIQFAERCQICTQLYGSGFPDTFDFLMAPYGLVFQYADLKWNAGKYSRAKKAAGNIDIVKQYHQDVGQGTGSLPFTFYVPDGYGKNRGKSIPNVQETSDSNLIFTASFNNEQEIWKELSLLSIP